MEQGYGSRRTSDGYKSVSPPTPDRFGGSPFINLASNSPATPTGRPAWTPSTAFPNMSTPSPSMSTASPRYTAPPGTPGGPPLFPPMPMRQNSYGSQGPQETGPGTPHSGNGSQPSYPPISRQLSSTEGYQQRSPQINDQGSNISNLETSATASPSTGGPPMPPPPPPPPPPLPGMTGPMPSWKDQQKANKKPDTGYHPSQNSTDSPLEGSTRPFCYLPPALHSTLSKDKKPFTYTPGGIDLSEIRSPRMQRRISANQQPPPIAPKPVSQLVQAEVHASQNQDPTSMQSGGKPQQVLPAFDPSQATRQLEGLNLHGPGRGQGGPYSPYQQQRQAPSEGYNTGSLPRNYHGQQQQQQEQYDNNFPQSKSFRILQMVTGTEKQDESDPGSPGASKREEDEMRFRGLRKEQVKIPSRSFQTLQRMTSTDRPVESPPPQGYYSTQNDPNEHHRKPSEGPCEEGPVDIRYLGGNIPSRSFKMLQEMTEGGMPPSVWQQQQEQQSQNSPVRKTSRVQVQMNPNAVRPSGFQTNQPAGHPGQFMSTENPYQPKIFPQPEVPASLQQIDPEPKKYTGGRIPSQSFRILQAMTGESPPFDEMDGTDF